MTQSVIDFPTQARVHVALATTDLARSRAFYCALLGQAPTKEKSDYLKFEVMDPPLNLALNATNQVIVAPGPEHFGVQLKSSEAVFSRAQSLREAGYQIVAEEGVSCCYARQDKIWVRDPDGRAWEIFVVLDDHVNPHDEALKRAETKSSHGSLKGCCEPGCCA